ncbi:MAG TPA: hypothetical protein VHW01_22560, partial [Polyangiaceae bacterium]|nr:hypothetical protein [Polyangiaceae bacterium]
SVGPRGELHGEDFTRFLIAPGEELTTDGVLGGDPSGRFVLIMQRGAVLLWDAQSRTSVDLSALGADARLSAESLASLRTLAFDASGEHLLYVKSGDSGARVVIRSLNDGSERALDPGPGPIWRARFDRGGAFVVLEMLTDDSNKNGKADFPAPLLTTPRPCTAGPSRFHTWSDRGDRPETVLVPLSGGAAIHEPDLVMPIGDALLLRDSTGALLLERAGKKHVLEPAACKGRIIHADAVRELFIVGCAQKKGTGRVNLELASTAGHKPLAIELASSELDRDLGDSPRLVPLYPGADSALFDADKREILPLQTGDIVVTTHAGHALVRRNNALFIYDADSHTSHALPGTLDKFPQILSAPPFAFVSPLLINVTTGAVVGQSKRRVLALATTGQILVTEADPAASGLMQGPLRWLTPALSAP